MNRICPTEELLSEYLSGDITAEERKRVEKHLASCAKCRLLVAEAYDIIKKPDTNEILNTLKHRARENLWFFGATSTLLLSFIFPKYFIQFLVACLLMGIKWVIDSKTTRTLITVHEALSRKPKKRSEEYQDTGSQ
jgi:hypothetical protein